MESTVICHPCDANSGIRRISPGNPIYEGEYWVVEHAYPTSLPGWLVIVLKRHCETLHELERVEWLELAELQYLSVRSLSDLFRTEKEYTCCFAEMEGFKHIHFHVVPKAVGTDTESVGTKAFHHLKVSSSDAVPPKEVSQICDQLSILMQKHAQKQT